MIEVLKNQVIDLLKTNKDCRNSDITLMIEIWRKYYPNKLFSNNDYVALKNLYDLPREDVIKRIRAKLQEEALKRIDKGLTIGDELCYLPTSSEVARKRQINAILWEKILGYYKKSLPIQTVQLPRPVGGISLMVVNINLHFIVIGSKGQKYNITRVDPYGNWSCDCESFRFDKKHKCKHIKEVENYLNKKFEDEVRKSQDKMF